MPFVPVPNTAEVTVKMTHLNEQVANIYHVERPAPWNEDTLTQLAEAFRTWWETETRTERSGSTCLEEICARDLTTISGLQVCVTHGIANCGTGLTQAMPGNVTIAIKEGTGLAGRSFRGRSYWVGLTEEMVENNVVTEPFLGNIIGDMNELSARVNALGATLVVVSKMSGSTCNVTTCKKIPTPRTTGVTTPITGYAANNVVDSQRRRLPGRGT
jgi:hypothetical protein